MHHFEGNIRLGTALAGHVVVIRYEGPGIREILTPTGEMKAMGLGDNAALITDGRFSGETSGHWTCLDFVRLRFLT